MPSQAYGKLIRLTYQLHQLWSAGLGDSAVAESVREQMDGLWSELGKVERARLGEFSEDLYLLIDGESGRQVKHGKQGTLYDVLPPGPAGAVIEATNGPLEGRRLVAYRSSVDGQLYVRQESEFMEPGRFQAVGEKPDASRGAGTEAGGCQLSEA